MDCEPSPALSAPAQLPKKDSVDFTLWTLPVVVPVFRAATLSTTVDGADGGLVEGRHEARAKLNTLHSPKKEEGGIRTALLTSHIVGFTVLF